MKKIILFLATIAPLLVFGQLTSTENHIHSIVYKVPVQDGNQGSVAPSNKIQGVTYYNGMGMPKQNIIVNAGGEAQSIVRHYEYDAAGREAKSYLPYGAVISNPLGLVTNAKQNTNSYYQTKFPQDFQNGLNPYHETQFDKSGRPIKIAAQGNDWMSKEDNTDHTVKISYGANIDNQVVNFGVEYPTDFLNPVLTYDGFYLKNELYLTTVKNENWTAVDGKSNTTETFKDKQGRTILARTYNKLSGLDVAHDQYNVYDDYGNLSFVISPKAMETLLGSASGTPSFSQTMLFKNVLGGTIGTANFSITNGNQFNVTVTTTGRNLPSGVIGALSIAMPDMAIGNITNGVYNFSLAIVSGNFLITNVAGVSPTTKIDESFTLTIPSLPASAVIDILTIDKLCYQYHYDDQNRPVEKRIPGKGWEYVVYDKLNRPILSQNENLRLQGKWMFLKYDTFGRITYSGEYSDSRTRATIQNEQDASVAPLFETRLLNSFTNGGTTIDYTNQAFPSTGINVFGVNYFDTYGFNSDGIALPATNVYLVPVKATAKGLPTGSKVRTLDTVSWTTSMVGYDKDKHAIWGSTKNQHLATADVSETKFDFLGNVLENKATHNRTGVTTNLVIFDYFTYDPMGRLLKHTQKAGSHAVELIAFNKYDELGRLVQKKNGGADATTYASAFGAWQTVDYSFNVRGWLSKINDPAIMGTDLFAYENKYNNPTAGGSALYNGAISQSFWKTANTDTSLKNYNYSYDNLDRLKEAKFFSSAGNDRYNEALSYDKNGNITQLQRSGILNSGALAPSLDNLAYTYDGNVLKNVVDTGNTNEGFDDHLTTGSTLDDYSYDANGNLTKDRNKDIVSITYNHIDLPVRITFSGTNRFIDFTYNAAGAKVSKKITDGATVTATEYTGGLVYQKINSGVPALQFFFNEEGYAAANAGVFTYIYQFKDHLDNVRLGYTKNTAGQLVIIEENHYYPFGMKHKGYNAVVNSPGNGIANNFRFNGQEGETKFGLNVTEMDFRQYDVAIGRFTGIDKLSEEFFSMTPYNFAGNNPVSYMDPSGLKLIAPQDPPYVPGGSVGNLSGIFGNHEHGYLDNLKVMAGGGGSPGGTGWGFGTGYSNSYSSYQQQMFGGYWEQTTVSGVNQTSYISDNGVVVIDEVYFEVTKKWVNTAIDNFVDGWNAAGKSNLLSGSAWTGYAGFHLSKTEALFKNVAKTSTGWSNKVSALKAAKVTAIAGKSLGLAGVGLSVFEDFQDGNVGIGTGVKVGIGLLTTFFGGPIVVGYAVLDLSVGIITGKNITDRLASGIEHAISN